MAELTRRRLLAAAGAAGVPAATPASEPVPSLAAEMVPLDGAWQFRLDGQELWKEVTVPHTWQIAPETAGYLGVAWYRKTFDAPAAWKHLAVRVEFEAVFHSAVVSLNGRQVGRHIGKGYTAFTIDLSQNLAAGRNTLVVRVDNSFSSTMLPRDNSYDWTPDGGITRPVRLLVTPQLFIERVEVDADPDLARRVAMIDARAIVRNAGAAAAASLVWFEVAGDASGEPVLRGQAGPVSIRPGESAAINVSLVMARPRLWHFDHPNLYRLTARTAEHRTTTTFGVRKLEVRDGAFYLNGERVSLMGVERMAGSHPDYGMAEPAAWIRHDHDDMKELNAVLTRVHWQQDRRVLDYCDRHGILIQVEVPTWGGNTFKGMRNEPSAEIMRNGLEQLREMIQRDRNHPSICSWGLCNEVNGQNPAAQSFVRRMYEEAKALDPRRLRSYASNSLEKTPERDVAGLMDFIEWNEYYESWYRGTPADLRRNLEEIHRAFPDKMVVISEYGLCECDPKHPAGDARRIEILRGHTGILREFPWVGGAIFFCYNDYRTHIGDKGAGVMKQRVHGVVDLYGARKPSFAALRQESSPVEELRIEPSGAGWKAVVLTRKTLPAYTLRGYRLRWIIYAHGNLPMEQHEATLAALEPGARAEVALTAPAYAERIRVEVMRPTGFSAASAECRLGASNA